MTGSHLRLRWGAMMMLLCSVPRTAARAAEPNETWSTATVLAPGVAVVTDRLDAVISTSNPDTTLGAFDQQQSRIDIDDDGSPIGNGLASALFDLPVNLDGSVRLAVSGFADFDFDGLNDFGNDVHSQSGAFTLDLSVFGAGGALLAQRNESGVLTPGAVRPFTFADESWIGGSFTVILDNDVALSTSDVDFWTFTGVPPNARFAAEVTGSQFDSVLGWFDDEGGLIAYDDDSALGLRSRIEGATSPGGDMHFAVSASADFSFVGAHAQEGRYRLELMIVPEPSALNMCLSTLGCVAASTLRRRRIAASYRAAGRRARTCG